jgi:hypothetical protein
MKAFIQCLSLVSQVWALPALSQIPQIPTNKSSDSIISSVRRENQFLRTQLDVIDVGMKIIGKDPERRFGEMDLKNMKLHLSLVPVIIYALSTGLVGGLLGNGVDLQQIWEWFFEKKLTIVLHQSFKVRTFF